MKLVASLMRGVEIMETFSSAQPKLKLQEIALKTGLPKATVYRLLRTLISLNYVHYDPRTAEYFLGPKVMSLGSTVISSLDLRETARPFLEELSRKTDQTVNMGILDGAEVVYIERIKKRKIISTDFYVGSRLCAYRSSIGKVILAYLEEKEFQAYLADLLKDSDAAKRLGSKGERLIDEMDEVRNRGYALNNEELFVGLRAAGAPVFNAQGKIKAGVNIPVFSQMCSLEELVDKFVPLLLDTARKVSIAFGYME